MVAARLHMAHTNKKDSRVSFDAIWAVEVAQPRTALANGSFIRFWPGTLIEKRRYLPDRFRATASKASGRLALSREQHTVILVNLPALGGNAERDVMPGMLFPWQTCMPQSKTYAKRAQECRWLATVSPPEFRQTYLKLADEYERLTSKPEKNREVSVPVELGLSYRTKATE